jgi:hypothetical protein
MKNALKLFTCIVLIVNALESKSFAFQTSPTNGALIITEVVIADNSVYSFIELRNNTESDLELSGVQLKDNTNTTLYTFGSGTLAPGGLIVLTNASDKFTFESNWGTLNGDVLFIVASNNLNITNTQAWSLEKDVTIDEATIGASGKYFLRDVGVSELINTNSNNTASPGELDVVFNGNIDISVLSDNTAAVNVFFNTNTSLPDTQIAAINNMHIANGTTLTINGGLTVNGEATNQGQLVVSSDEDSSGSLIANNQVGNLELTYERHIENAGRWNSISSPVEGLIVNDFVNSNDIRIRPSNTDQIYLNMYDQINASEDNTFNENFLYFNTTDQSIPHNTILSASNPVILRKETAGRFNFNGKLKKDNTLISIINNTNASQWQFIGNPFPSFLSVKKFLSHNEGNLLGGQNNALFIYDEQRAMWQPLTNVNNAFIAPGQAFFIKSGNQGGTDIEITKDMLEHNLNDIFGNSPQGILNPEVRLRFDSNSVLRYARIFYTNEATDNNDSNIDAILFSAFKLGNHEIFTKSISNNSPLSIQGFNTDKLNDNIEIPVGINLPENNSTIITLNTSSENPLDDEFKRKWNVIFEDRLNNVFTNLSSGNSYTINTTNNRLNGDENRFYVHISSQIVTLSNSYSSFKDNLVISKSNNTIRISGIDKTKIVIEILDLNGKNIFQTTTHNNTFELNNFITSGIYILKLKIDNKTFSKKILIN